MGRNKKFNEPIRASVVMERKMHKEIKEIHPNFSEWVVEKIEEELNVKTTLEQTELRLIEVQKKKEEAQIIAQAAEKEEEELALRINVINNPTSTLQKAQTEAMEKAIKAITNTSSASRAVELATVHAKILRARGLSITQEELLTRADNAKNPMFR